MVLRRAFLLSLNYQCLFLRALDLFTKIALVLFLPLTVYVLNKFKFSVKCQYVGQMLPNYQCRWFQATQQCLYVCLAGELLYVYT